MFVGIGDRKRIRRSRGKIRDSGVWIYCTLISRISGLSV